MPFPPADVLTTSASGFNPFFWQVTSVIDLTDVDIVQAATNASLSLNVTPGGKLYVAVDCQLLRPTGGSVTAVPSLSLAFLLSNKPVLTLPIVIQVPGNIWGVSTPNNPYDGSVGAYKPNYPYGGFFRFFSFISGFSGNMETFPNAKTASFAYPLPEVNPIDAQLYPSVALAQEFAFPFDTVTLNASMFTYASEAWVGLGLAAFSV